MPKSTNGLQAFYDNIDKMKQVGRDRDASRNDEARRNTEAHNETMEQRARDAVAAKEAKRLEGIARRDAHNEMLRQQREQRWQRTEQIKGVRLRAA